jgi:hypothetical protein
MIGPLAGGAASGTGRPGARARDEQGAVGCAPVCRQEAENDPGELSASCSPAPRCRRRQAATRGRWLAPDAQAGGCGPRCRGNVQRADAGDQPRQDIEQAVGKLPKDRTLVRREAHEPGADRSPPTIDGRKMLATARQNSSAPPTMAQAGTRRIDEQPPLGAADSESTGNRRAPAIMRRHQVQRRNEPSTGSSRQSLPAAQCWHPRAARPPPRRRPAVQSSAHLLASGRRRVAGAAASHPPPRLPISSRRRRCISSCIRQEVHQVGDEPNST